jgi:ribosomal protein S18 acetylase RimI-like enzyme
VEIREMDGRKELKEAIRIEHKELYQSLTEKQLMDWEKDRRMFAPLYFVAKDGEKTVGFIVLYPYEIMEKEVIFEVSVLAVQKEYQGRGIGTKLLRNALLKAADQWKEYGYKLKGALVLMDDDRDIHCFYEHAFRLDDPPWKKVNTSEITLKNVWSNGEGLILFFAQFD